MVNVEDLKTHIVEGERCQRHSRSQSSSQVSFDERFLRACNPQIRTQRPQPHQRYQKHQRPHLRFPPLPPCQPPSRTRRLLQLVHLELSQDSSRFCIQQFSLRGHQNGEGKQQPEQLT